MACFPEVAPGPGQSGPELHYILGPHSPGSVPGSFGSRAGATLSQAPTPLPNSHTLSSSSPWGGGAPSVPTEQPASPQNGAPDMVQRARDRTDTSVTLTSAGPREKGQAPPLSLCADPRHTGVQAGAGPRHTPCRCLAPQRGLCHRSVNSRPPCTPRCWKTRRRHGYTQSHSKQALCLAPFCPLVHSGICPL